MTKDNEGLIPTGETGVLATMKAVGKIEARQAEAVAEFARLRIVQTRGPTIKAEAARLLARQEFETKGRTPCAMVFEIYETRGGALIAVSRSTPIEFDGFEDVRAVVVDTEAIYSERPALRQATAQDMHFAVMDHFSWEDRARTMARKLGWKLNREVA